MCACRGLDGGVGVPRSCSMLSYHASLLPIAFRAFETQMTRLEAEFVRREAPPSYGQLIAQGLIPPVEDFPVYSASQVSFHKYVCVGWGWGIRPGFFFAGPQRAPKTRRPRGKLELGCLESGKGIWFGGGSTD